MQYLKSLYPEIKGILKQTIPTYWSELRLVLEPWFEEELISETLLPLASCQAVNGNPQKATPVAAALLTLGICLRILDELEDQDRSGQLWEQVGSARAWNYASAIHILSFEILSRAPLNSKIFHKINQCYIDTFLCVAAGQDRDLIGLTKTVEDYWKTVEMKSAGFVATACATGAMVGTDNPELVQACGVFGHHLGTALQILNDMESIWQPNGITDLQQNKVTLPLLYGLSFEHNARDELLSFVQTSRIANHAERIKDILNGIDARGFLVWAALKEREQALQAIKICPNLEGRKALTTYITAIFKDIDSLLQEQECDRPIW